MTYENTSSQEEKLEQEKKKNKELEMLLDEAIVSRSKSLKQREIDFKSKVELLEKLTLVRNISLKRNDS